VGGFGRLALVWSGVNLIWFRVGRICFSLERGIWFILECSSDLVWCDVGWFGLVSSGGIWFGLEL
jgi:hypothetical protein